MTRRLFLSSLAALAAAPALLMGRGRAGAEPNVACSQTSVLMSSDEHLATVECSAPYTVMFYAKSGFDGHWREIKS